VAITFSGEFTSPRTPGEVYDFLCDANKFGPLLPDFESMSVEDATHFTVKVRVGVGNIRGTAEIRMELSQAVRPIRAQYQGRGNAVGSQIAISTGFDLSPLLEGTRIAWQGEASVFGKLALLAGGMLEPVSRKNIQMLMDGLQSALASPPAQGSHSQRRAKQHRARPPSSQRLSRNSRAQPSKARPPRLRSRRERNCPRQSSSGLGAYGVEKTRPRPRDCRARGALPPASPSQRQLVGCITVNCDAGHSRSAAFRLTF
jgi:carbon monoxide dehydrogenase subunit G